MSLPPNLVDLLQIATNTDAISKEYLLMIATVSGINEYGNKSRAVLLLLVLELYHDVPKKYLEMLMIAMRKSFPQWIHILPHTLKKDKAEDSKSSRFRLSKIYEYLASRASKQLVEHVCRDVDKKEKESSLFKSYCKPTCNKRGFYLTNYSSARLRIPFKFSASRLLRIHT